jgi:hypothetical protein
MLIGKVFVFVLLISLSEPVLPLAITVSGFAFGRISEHFTVNQAQTLIEAQSLI